MNPPPPPFNCEVFSPCWCSVAGRENNPNCKQSVSIQSDLFALLLVVFIVVYTLWVFKIIKSFPIIFKRNSNWESKKILQ